MGEFGLGEGNRGKKLEADRAGQKQWLTAVQFSRSFRQIRARSACFCHVLIFVLTSLLNLS